MLARCRFKIEKPQDAPPEKLEHDHALPVTLRQFQHLFEPSRSRVEPNAWLHALV
jgi:hypothetical protein